MHTREPCASPSQFPKFIISPLNPKPLQEVEELCNDNARLCNQLRTGLRGGNLATFNADVAHMAAYLDPATLAGAAARDVPRPARAPDLDTLIVEATCRRGESA